MLFELPGSDNAVTRFECKLIRAMLTSSTCDFLAQVRLKNTKERGTVLCYCVTNTYGMLPSSKCDVNCSDGQSCGGLYSYSVYKGRLECKNFSTHSQYVTVTTFESQQMNLLELEAYPLENCSVMNGGCDDFVCLDVQPDFKEYNASVRCYEPDEDFITIPEASKKKLNFKGCFVAVVSEEKKDKIGTVQSCYEHCVHTVLFAMQNAKYCLCVRSVEHELSANKCNKKCSDDLSCGGRRFYSVYASNKLVKLVDNSCRFTVRFKDQVNRVFAEFDAFNNPLKYHFCLDDVAESVKAYCRSGTCSYG
ncbi:hypothetical protein HELRODRAFT_177767 [Helobdella robusta]|uniref:WSC domain-containing protein n=1 Tax=Helobdella robusta TaxID=6412 RepID=T1FC80_HELRO|nr:hypothetical protein HELRODRAFT_177767 [Helobdella robusta]ESN97708.1 hypothetical protein HELRODRAFT_177767 [Helobdella robusta]